MATITQFRIVHGKGEYISQATIDLNKNILRFLQTVGIEGHFTVSSLHTVESFNQQNKVEYTMVALLTEQAAQ